MPVIDDGEKETLIGCLHYLNNEIVEKIRRQVQSALGVEPAAMRVLLDLIGDCQQALQTKPNGPCEVDDRFAPLIKRALIANRRAVATRRDEHRELTIDPDLRAAIDAQVDPLDRLLQKADIVDVQPAHIPHLTDYLSIGVAQEVRGSSNLSERVYDEKFHILQSPRLFLSDLQLYRELCDMRGRPLSVVFMDIDNFKDFNTEFTEVVVDQNLLPKFMMEIEAQVFNRGLAYRFAGDEYVLLLPNLRIDEAIAVLKDFQEKLAGLSFPGIKRNPTVSMGVCTGDEDCLLTDMEILEAANRGKNHAKDQGKDCIAEVVGAGFGPEDFRVVS